MKAVRISVTVAVASLFLICALAISAHVSDAKDPDTDILPATASSGVGDATEPMLLFLSPDAETVYVTVAPRGAMIEIPTPAFAWLKMGNEDRCPYRGWEIDGRYYECHDFKSNTMSFVVPLDFESGAIYYAEFSNGPYEFDTTPMAIVGGIVVAIGCVATLFYTRP